MTIEVDDSVAQLNLQALLKAMLDKGASDLHITAGSPPRLRIDNELVRLQTEPMTPVDTKQLCYSVMNDERTTHGASPRTGAGSVSVSGSRARQDESGNGRIGDPWVNRIVNSKSYALFSGPAGVKSYCA